GTVARRGDSAAGVLLRPGRGALDDEQVLAWADVSDPPCLAGEAVDARLLLEPRAQPGALGAQHRDLRPTLVELIARLQVRVDRPDVEEADRREDDEREHPARNTPATQPPVRRSRPRRASFRGLSPLRHATDFDARPPPPVQAT